MYIYSEFPTWISAQVVPFLPIRWYAVMYLVAFSLAYILFRYQCKRGALGGMDSEKSLDLFCYVIFGLIIGARVASCLIYDGTWYYWTHPWMIFWPFRNGRFIGLPGMSYHGGVVGAIVGGLIYSKKHGYRFFDIADTIVAAVPLGYTFGRLGNFINGELWGRVTGTSYGMVFPDAELFSTTLDWVRDAADAAGIQYTAGQMVNLPRHPSQLYEAFFEGIFLFLVLWFVIRPIAKKRGPGLLTGSYFLGYGIIRFLIEYFRQPDEQIGFIIALGKETEPLALFHSFLNISLGQILCLLMVVAGAVLIIVTRHSEPTVWEKKKGGKRK